MARDGADFLLEMVGISKSFPGVRALDDVTLRVRPGKVHALMGENGAGKSTLMKCLFGIYREDSGDMVLKGRKIKFHSAKDALEAGVSMIHQELSNVPERSVSENIWLGREPLHRIGPVRLLNHRKMREDTAVLMSSLDMEIRPSERMGGLSISKQQACEIAKAVSYDASVVAMDEPSSSLTETETAHLFKIIRDLTAKGVAVIYISHRMSEIFQIADEVSIMRDGRMIGTYPIAEIDEDRLIKLMVGRDDTHRFPPVESTPGSSGWRYGASPRPIPAPSGTSASSCGGARSSASGASSGLSAPSSSSRSSGCARILGGDLRRRSQGRHPIAARRDRQGYSPHHRRPPRLGDLPPALDHGEHGHSLARQLSRHRSLPRAPQDRERVPRSSTRRSGPRLPRCPR